MAEAKRGLFGRTGDFFTEVRSEMRKVTWPTRSELYGATIVVVVVSILLAVLLGFGDALIGRVVEFIMASRS